MYSTPVVNHVTHLWVLLAQLTAALPPENYRLRCQTHVVILVGVVAITTRRRIQSRAPRKRQS